MATNRFKCEGCEYIGPVSEFDLDCPQCRREDVFPYRTFECLDCGEQADQSKFFPNHEGDPDPLEEKWAATCPNRDCTRPEDAPLQFKQVA